MNLSGNAVRFGCRKENILENVLVITDDLFPFGTLRLRKKGSDAGHNGLKNIQEVLQHKITEGCVSGFLQIFSEGKQVDYVLGKWNEEELKTLQDRIDVFRKSVSIIRFAGMNNTMNTFNGEVDLFKYL